VRVEDLDAAIEFFTELGLELEGRAPVEGDWADGVTGLRNMRVEIALMRTPDGHSRLEMSRFLAPATSGVPKGFSSGSPNSSGSKLPERIP
jgi:catechol 2,3-dioxygenase-like lactoylglutathione lyase family enzyme